jgi:hypothetical protein
MPGDLHDVYVVDTKNTYKYGSSRYVAVCSCGWNSAGFDPEHQKQVAAYHFLLRTAVKYPGEVELLDNYKPFGKPIPAMESVSESGPKPEPPASNIIESSTAVVHDGDREPEPGNIENF